MKKAINVTYLRSPFIDAAFGLPIFAIVMRNVILLLAIFYFNASSAQSIFGKWKTIDDETQKIRSVIEIGMENGEVHGKIINIFLQPDEKDNAICSKCSKDDPRYNKKVLGMNVFENLHKKKETKYWEGKILDPKNGKVYSCKIWPEDGNLKVRGYWTIFYRTQTWIPF